MIGRDAIALVLLNARRERAGLSPVDRLPWSDLAGEYLADADKVLELIGSVTHRTWGRAFRRGDGTLYVDTQDDSFESREAAAAMTKEGWEGHPYDLVVFREEGEWRVSER